MTPRYVIHIGPFKTASTYIQECLTSARAALAAEGVCYPAELADPSAKFMHMPVVRALKRNQGETLRPVFAALNAAGHKTVVLSCEHMVFLKPAEMRVLRDVTGASDVRVVYTCRRWSDRLASIWNQNLLMGDTQSLPEFFFSLTAGEAPSYMPKWLREQGPGADLDYSVTWKQVEDVFGRDGLTIFPYSDIMDRGGDVYEHFCRDVLGLEAAPPTALKGSRRWSSLPADDQEILRRLNMLYVAEHGEPTDQLRVQMMRRRKQYDTSLISAAMAPSMAEMAIDDHFVQFDAAFESMSRYADRVAGAGVLFEKRRKAAKYVRSGYLLSEGVREAYTGIYRQMLTEVPVREAKAKRKEAAVF